MTVIFFYEGKWHARFGRPRVEDIHGTCHRQPARVWVWNKRNVINKVKAGCDSGVWGLLTALGCIQTTICLNGNWWWQDLWQYNMQIVPTLAWERQKKKEQTSQFPANSQSIPKQMRCRITPILALLSNNTALFSLTNLVRGNWFDLALVRKLFITTELMHSSRQNRFLKPLQLKCFAVPRHTEQGYCHPSEHQTILSNFHY